MFPREELCCGIAFSRLFFSNEIVDASQTTDRGIGRVSAAALVKLQGVPSSGLTCRWPEPLLLFGYRAMETHLSGKQNGTKYWYK